MPVNNVELGHVKGRSPDDETAAFIMTLVLFGAISTYGAMVLSGVVEEKSSRTVEVLLARMPARNLLAGKIAGIGLLGLAQIAVDRDRRARRRRHGRLRRHSSGPRPASSPGRSCGSCSATRSTPPCSAPSDPSRRAPRTPQSVAGPVTVLLVVGFMVSFAAIGSADTTWARLVSWFPLTAPFAMPNRIAMGAATWWDPIVAVALTLATIAGLVISAVASTRAPSSTPARR